MGSLVEVYPGRVNNEIMVAESLKRLSEKEEDSFKKIRELVDEVLE